ncbi:hypothetical protein TWF694_009303 [Orbilia ellipsospora]|uniref:SET domain-containing protein n=1 Tax=Orbilia ellipsospora TaxID=2528407 RepID=A0AAV9XEK2_9PEZI
MTISRSPTPDLSSLTIKDGGSADEKKKKGEADSFVRRDLYEERQTLESGIGVFATVVIPSGTRIFCEESVVMLPDAAGQLELYQAVKALSGGKSQMYWNLAGSTKPSKDVGWIDTLRSSCEEDATENFNTLVEEHEQAWSIYETNRFICRSLDGPKTSLGVFPASARINHSCSPNVFHRYSPTIDRLTVHALREIQPGEELVTSYIDICHPTAVRRQILKHWGFRCRCAACDSPDDEEDHRRKKIEDLYTKLKGLEKKRASSTKEKGYEKFMNLVTRVIKLLEKEGMEESDTLGVAYKTAVRVGMILGTTDRERLVEWAEKAVGIEAKCLGEDSKEYIAATRLLEAARQSQLDRMDETKITNSSSLLD